MVASTVCFRILVNMVEFSSTLTLLCIVFLVISRSSFGFEFEEINDPLSADLQKKCVWYMPAGQVREKSEKVVLTRAFMDALEDIQNMEVRESDVWIISFPKCGSTWTQEMVWLLKHNINYEAAKATFLYERVPFLEYRLLWGERAEPAEQNLEEVIPDIINIVKTSRDDPRIIKTHLPSHLLPKEIWTKKPKIVYVFRNPKDVAISYYHHFQVWNNYRGSQDLFLKAFVNDKVVFSPIWDHAVSFWKLKDEPNILFNTYEEMKEDLGKVLRRTAEFLGETYDSEKESQLLEHLSFENMKKNKAVNFEDDIRQIERHTQRTGLSYMRKGMVGEWKEVFTQEQNDEYNTWGDKYINDYSWPSQVKAAWKGTSLTG